jgi:hypothetical protein
MNMFTAYLGDMDFRVETDVPLPPMKRGRPPKYHWDSLNVGDSVAFPVGPVWEAAKASAHRYFKEKGWEMTTRVLGEFGRIWRVK